VVVRQTDSGWRFLMLRAYRDWDFPKGLVEKDENPLDAARREVTEETLIRDLQFLWGEACVETAPYSRNKVARYYLGATKTEAVTLPVRPELGRPEHNEYRWASYGEAMELSSPRVQPVLRWAASAMGVVSAPSEETS
jgi:8-oxo-dGTP pyrophosphatase MutT (NUDIX family)